MKRVVLFMFLFTMVGGSLLSACAAPSYVLRYRLTLVVEADGETMTGSSVVELNFSDNDARTGFTQEIPWKDSWRGEATMVDLGSQGSLFCLLRGDPTRRDSPKDPSRIALNMFPGYGRGLARGLQGAEHLRNLLKDKPKTTIELATLPMLVHFADINDPKTVELVDPLDLEKSFGSGVKIVSATIEITDEPVTQSIVKQLPWLQAFLSDGAAPSLDGDRSIARRVNAPLSNQLTSGYFKVGN